MIIVLIVHAILLLYGTRLVSVMIHVAFYYARSALLLNIYKTIWIYSLTISLTIFIDNIIYWFIKMILIQIKVNLIRKLGSEYSSIKLNKKSFNEKKQVYFYISINKYFYIRKINVAFYLCISKSWKLLNYLT